MKEEESERLKYRNQYLLTPSGIECPFLHNIFNIGGGYVLYTHKDLVVNSVEKGDVKLFLLGELFDYTSPKKNNEEILKDLIDYNFDSLLEHIGKYTGRYVIIHLNGDKLNLVHDPIASRKIYYCRSQDDVWMASQSHLLAKVLGIKKTNNSEILSYYNSREFGLLNNANIGNLTLYDEIRQLMPNHFLAVKGMKSIRYWPKTTIERRSLKEVSIECAKMIEGYMESIINRHEVMLPVTAGKDSRILLAASKRFKEKVFYYSNKSGFLTDKHADISVPTRLLADLNLDFNILVPPGEVDKNFEKIFFFNNEYASTNYLPIIFNYHTKFSNKINLPGNMASAGLEFYKSRKIKKTGNRLAHLNHVGHYVFANEYYDNWLAERQFLFQNLNFEMIELFYWEERLPNWGMQIQMEKDIAQEEFNLFNSRDLISLFLSVKPKYIAMPFFKLHEDIIKLLWPEVLKIPINPGFRTSLQKILKPIGLLDAYYQLKN